MPIVTCANGHYYDDAKYGDCPHCGVALANAGQDIKTVAMAAGKEPLATASNDTLTVSLYKKRLNADPVTAWLVCVDGSERGRDYRIRAGRNFVGRSPEMDIAIAGDDTISRVSHCSVVYDPAGNSFALVPGENSGTYLNEKPLVAPTELRENDVIRIGESRFVFIAYCKGDRKWF